MKHTLIIMVIMLLTSGNSFAQNEINGFLGVKFGDANYVVIDVLKKKYPQLEWKSPCITISKISFLGVTFDNLVITFKNGTLTEGIFTLSETTSALLDEYPFRTQAQTQATIKAKQESIINKYGQLFNDIGNTFASKYGDPNSFSKGYAVWKDDKLNSIKLKISLGNHSGDNTIYFDGKLSITYQIGMPIDDF